MWYFGYWFTVLDFLHFVSSIISMMYCFGLMYVILVQWIRDSSSVWVRVFLLKCCKRSLTYFSLLCTPSYIIHLSVRFMILSLFKSLGKNNIADFVLSLSVQIYVAQDKNMYNNPGHKPSIAFFQVVLLYTRNYTDLFCTFSLKGMTCFSSC